MLSIGVKHPDHSPHLVPRLRMKLHLQFRVRLWYVQGQLCVIFHILMSLVGRYCNSCHPSCPVFGLLRPVTDIANRILPSFQRSFQTSFFVWLVFQDLFWQPVRTPAVSVLFCNIEILLLVEFVILVISSYIVRSRLCARISQFFSWNMFLPSVVSDAVHDSLS